MGGVRGRLVTAIGLVAAMTVVGGIVSWFFYSRIEGLLIAVVRDETPTISLSLKLAEASSRFAAGSLAYSAAHNHLQRQSVAVALDQQAHQLEEILGALRGTAIDHTRLDLIQRLVTTLERNLEQQNQQIEAQLNVDGRVRRAQAAFRRDSDGFSAALHRAALEQIGDSAATKRLWEVDALGDRMVTTVTEVEHLDRIEQISQARTAFEANRQQLAALFPAASDSLGLAVAALGAHQQSPDSAFALREAAIRSREQVHALNEESRNIVSQLSIAVVRLVDEVEGRSAEMGRKAGDQITAGRGSILAIAVATFLGPMVFVWLLIGRTIVVPLTSLAAATRRIAGGDLAAPIPTSGKGEIADLAEALVVFRDNAAALHQAKEEAERALHDLRQAQEQLVQSEKLAALGGLVAGVAHEINTPIGIVLTGASLLAEETETIRTRADSGSLKRSDFNAYLDTAGESSAIILDNIQRAADLIQSFKNVAADQVSDVARRFNLKAYCGDVITSLSPSWRKAGHVVELEGPDDIEIDGYPGLLSHILTNFITNSVIHGFAPGQKGALGITLSRPSPTLVELIYTDTGRGIPVRDQGRVFEPFFTTRRGIGCTGLGLHIVYNLVTGRLGGQIRLESREGGGVRFVLRFPCDGEEAAAG